MKNRYWLVLIGALLLISCGVGVLFSLPGTVYNTAEIWSDNQLIRTVDLREDQTFRVEIQEGYNIITVENGRIAVSEADCPDQYCVSCGFCNSGAAIVCLPHRLIIKFVGESVIDGIIG